MEIELRAAAKINLCLSVSYPPRGGYHALESVFQCVDLHDTLSFTDRTQGRSWETVPSARTQAGTRVYLLSEGLAVGELPVERNLVFRAVDAMECACGSAMLPGGVLGVRVHKRIPAGAGLGGGSSDAAAAIRAYAQLHDIDPLDERCLDVARGIGADVAFFLHGGCALMGGCGDVLVRQLPSFPLPIVLMGEEEGNATAAVYALFDGDPPQTPDAHALARALESADLPPQGIAMLCANNLGPAACALSPKLGQRVTMARESPHVLNALVTGSGSTSYAICRDEQAARAFERDMVSYCAWTHRCHYPGRVA